MKIDKSTYYPKSPLDDESWDSTPDSKTEGEAPVSTECVREESLPAAEELVCVEESSASLEPSDTERALTGAANFLSWTLVPLLMPLYGTLLAFGLSLLAYTSFEARLAFTAIIFAFNVLAPALLILLLKHMGIVSDIGLNGRRERLIPYLVCIICLIGTALFMRYKGAPTWLVMFYYGGAAAGVVEVVVNNWWKISVHAAGIAGIVALLARLSGAEYASSHTFGWLIAAIAAAGLLGSARIWLGRHTLGQVLTGYGVGFLCVYFFMSIQ